MNSNFQNSKQDVVDDMPPVKKEKINIQDCYNLWIHDPEAGEQMMIKAEPNYNRRELLLAGFERIRKNQLVHEKIPSWWKKVK